mgnify:CR=1 FL=1
MAVAQDRDVIFNAEHAYEKLFQVWTVIFTVAEGNPQPWVVFIPIEIIVTPDAYRGAVPVAVARIQVKDNGGSASYPR